MRKKLIGLAIFIGVALAASSASAMTYYMTRDLGVHDNQHLCRYSNNKVYAFNATEICPINIEDDDPQANTNSRVKQTGYSVGEYQDGMTKVCVYNVMGRKEAIRIGSVELCPISHDF